MLDFELMDAVMTTRHASSLAEFSLSPMFRRQYPSTYEALEDSRPSRNPLMKLYISNIPIQKYIVLAIDHSPWGRPDAQSWHRDDRRLLTQSSRCSLSTSIGQWVEPGGSVTVVAMSGRNIIQQICREDKRVFRATAPIFIQG
jgi:hypothetical protein